MQRARTIVADYRIILDPDQRLGYIGSAVEMPTVFADGRTPDACVQMTRDALALAVATMLEMGKRPPTSPSQRTQQVNIRLTADEKTALEESALRMGFRGLSDFIRAAAIDRAARN